MVQLLMNCESVVMISAAIEVSAAHSSNELASKFLQLVYMHMLLLSKLFIKGVYCLSFYDCAYGLEHGTGICRRDMSTLELYLRMRIVYARAHDRLATVAKEVQ